MVGCQHNPETACEACQLNYDQAMRRSAQHLRHARSLGLTKFAPPGWDMNMVALIRELVIKSRPVLGTGNTSGAGKI